MSDEKQSRFAELALELFGAQAADKFLAEAWQAASPEVKQSLADAIIQRLLWDAGRSAGFRVTSDIYSQLVAPVLERLRKDEVVLKQIEEAAQKAISDLPERLGSAIEQEVRERVRTAREKVAKLFPIFG